MTLKSPLRYPGGKAKIYPYMAKLIEDNFSEPPIYVEGFVGGAGLALKLLENKKVSKIIINDYDPRIYYLWSSILHNTKGFISLIKGVKFNIEEWDYHKNIYTNYQEYTKLEVGFSTFYLNRCNRSGIIKAGPIGGRNQDGDYLLGCRFNKESLIETITAISKNKKKIKLYHQDAKKFINTIDNKYENLFIYLDPPYVKKGKELYQNHFKNQDHIKLFKSVSTLSNKWFITYDNHDLVKNLYIDYNPILFNLNYSVDKPKTGEEIAIFSTNLSKKLNPSDYLKKNK